MIAVLLVSNRRNDEYPLQSKVVIISEDRDEHDAHCEYNKYSPLGKINEREIYKTTRISEEEVWVFFWLCHSNYCFQNFGSQCNRNRG